MTPPDFTAATAFLGLAFATSLGLALAALARGPRRVPQWTFAAGMLVFAAETGAIFALVGTDTPEGRAFVSALWLAVASVAPIPWGVFVASLALPDGSTPPQRRLRWWAIGGGLICVAAAACSALLPVFIASDVPGPFYAVQLDSAGYYVILVQLAATVAVLWGLEICLRASRHETRWRLKYLLLALGGIFIGRFFFLSQILLVQVVLATYLTTGAAIIALGNSMVALSLARHGIARPQVTVSRAMTYRSVVVGIMGAYLLVVGLLGWLLRHLAIPDELFWTSVLVFVSGLLVAALSLSEDLRWRLKRFIGTHFYRSKYDYRDQWILFTKRLGSLLSPEELGSELLVGLTEAAGAARAALYVGDSLRGGLYLAAAVNLDSAPRLLEASDPIVAGLAAGGRPRYLEGAAASTPLARQLGEGAVAFPLCWREAQLGAIAIGPERTGIPYTTEDLEFFMTVGEQAAGVIMTARLSESLAQAREFEAFHQLTSFIIHDVKNAVTALSLLSRNALQHFDDPEFQRDAITTLSRTVDRMTGLLSRLSGAPDAAPLRLQAVDLSTLALEALRPIGGGRVVLVKELSAVPLISGDPEALLRVLQNLVTNAVEAIQGEGTVTVQTFEEGGAVVCSVSDTGTGMSPELIRKSLFAPFRSTKPHGWGIGLYHAKGLVEAHGGAMEVKSTEGRGTTFRVRLPISAGRPSVDAR